MLYTRTGAWVRSLLGRKPARVVAVAIANKTARTAWAMLCDVKIIAPLRWIELIRTAAATGCRSPMQGQMRMMMIERDRCRNTPRCCQGFTARSSDRDPACGLHQGQRSNAPRQQAGQMTATRIDQRNSTKPLHKRSRPQMTAPGKGITMQTALHGFNHAKFRSTLGEGPSDRGQR